MAEVWKPGANRESQAPTELSGSVPYIIQLEIVIDNFPIFLCTYVTPSSNLKICVEVPKASHPGGYKGGEEGEG